MTKDYFVIHEFNLDNLEDMVKKKLGEGWQPYGELKIIMKTEDSDPNNPKINFFQVMVLAL